MSLVYSVYQFCSCDAAAFSSRIADWSVVEFRSPSAVWVGIVLLSSGRVGVFARPSFITYHAHVIMYLFCLS